MPKQVWIDVEDLFEFAAYNPRPSGIQRMAFEIYRAIQQLEGAGSRINFIRHDQVNFTFATVSWASVEALFTHLAQGAPSSHMPPAHAASLGTQGPRIESALRRTARKAAYRMPLDLRHRVFTTARLQATALRAMADLASFAIRGAIRRANSMPQRLGRRLRYGGFSACPPAHNAAGVGVSRQFTRDAQPGDVILLLGAPWSSPNYAQMIEAARAEFGIEFAVLIYDLIPIRRAEWCDRGLVRLFRQWFDSTMPVSDHVFTISHATRIDLARYLEDNGIPTRAGDIKVIPVGTSFSDKMDAARSAPVPAGDAPSRIPLPEPGTYVLFVSTIEARKNHMLLFRVWRRLVEAMPADRIPTLVFAGRVGWLVADLMQQLDNTNWLDGKIRLIEAPADRDIAALYRGCMFTVFPSLYEGWGLPVTESLANGKPCVASNSTSMPEAGGKLARYFDPDSVTDAYRVIRDTIADKQDLDAWQAEVARGFKPVSWTESAACILDALSATTPKPAMVRPKEPTV